MRAPEPFAPDRSIDSGETNRDGSPELHRTFSRRESCCHRRRTAHRSVDRDLIDAARDWRGRRGGRRHRRLLAQRCASRVHVAQHGRRARSGDWRVRSRARDAVCSIRISERCPDGAVRRRRLRGWLDDSRLVVADFEGPLPEQVSCSFVPGYSSCPELAANTYSVLDAAGSMLGQAPGTTPIVSAGGSTALTYAGWIDVNEILAGSAPLHAFSFDRVELIDCLSPDGLSVVLTRDRNGKRASWIRLTLRTDERQTLGTTQHLVGRGGCAWSPDGKTLAAVDGLRSKVLLVPMSKGRGRIVGALPLGGTTPTLVVWAAA